jgi:hypothetical protein
MGIQIRNKKQIFKIKERLPDDITRERLLLHDYFIIFLGTYFFIL